MSTVGTASVPGVSGTALKLFDEDMGLWSLSDGKWQLSFDGDGIFSDFTNINWKLASKDVIAYTYGFEMDMHYWNAPMMPIPYDWDFIVLQGNGTFTWNLDDGPITVAYTQKDILGFGVVEEDEGTYVGAAVDWHGPDHGWNYNIDAIDYLTPFGP